MTLVAFLRPVKSASCLLIMFFPFPATPPLLNDGDGSEENILPWISNYQVINSEVKLYHLESIDNI